MTTNFLTSKFYKELESSLPSSTEVERRIWANTIIEKDIDLKHLSNLLKGEPKIASRYLWLLSDIGIFNPNKLFTALPYLFDLCNQLDPIYKRSFASFWLYAGVPIENEGAAVELLFQLLISTETNVTIKARAMLVLFKLTEKYPELKNELKLCLKDQMDKYSVSFKKRVIKVLNKLEE